MRVLITGGSGFIGSRLADRLLRDGHEVLIADLLPPSDKRTRFVKADLVASPPDQAVLSGVDAVAHLAGVNIFRRWNPQVKRAIYDSRVVSTRNLVRVMVAMPDGPKVLVSASAVGYYGDRGEEELFESSPPGDDFLARLCVDWEAEARRAEDAGCRTVQIRTAPVLGRGGLLGVLLPIFRLGLGGPIASGRQWMPWVHIDDIAGIYEAALTDPSWRGPFNSCAPGIVRNEEFTAAIAKVLRRPAFFRVPAWALRPALGEVGRYALASAKMRPRKLEERGFAFRFPALDAALKDVLA